MEHRFLGEICCPKQWKTISTSELTETGYPVYGANGIIGKYKEYNHEKATILVTCRGATCGSVVISKPYSYVNGNAMALDNLDDDICIDYLYFYLIGRGFADVISGSAQPQIIRSTIEKIRIPLCNFEKQKQIASVFSTINGMKLKFELLIEKYDQLVKARFVEMFSNNNYPILKWCEVFNTTTGRLDSNASVENGKYPFFTCSKDILKIDSYAFDQKALLLAGNNAAGKYDVKYYSGKFNAYQRTYVLGLKDNWSYQLFKYQLEDKLTYLQQQSLGGLTKYLTMKILEQLDFIVPPIEKQLEFDDFVKQVDKSKLAVQQSLEKTQQLFDSLMQKYFG